MSPVAAPRAPLHVHPWPGPLVEGRLLRRRNRFLADVELADGTAVTAHCVNSGRMEGLVVPGARVWLTHEPSPKRTLAWTWQMIEVDGILVGANTILPNQLVRAMIAARALPGFASWREWRAEFPYGESSRVDFHFRSGAREHFLEVKNCHLVLPDRRGYFPDSVSERATHHLAELTRVVASGHRATVLFTVQRPDARSLRPSDLHDPAFARAARAAASAGVAFRALLVEPTLGGLRVTRTLPVDLRPYDLEPVRAWSAALAPKSGWRQVRRPRAGSP